MPKRTNEFQQIILMIQKQLAGDAVVTESKMLEDKDTGSRAEVDIVIDTTIAGIELAVGIECTAIGRAATVEWVREMIGKHENLPLNKSILVSKSGFTREAMAKAEAKGFLALKLEQAEGLNWKELLGDLESLMLGSFNFKITGAQVEYNKYELTGEELNICLNTRIKDDKGDLDATFLEFINGIIRNNRMAGEVMRQWVKTPQDERNDSFEVSVTMTPHNKTVIESKSGVWFTIKTVKLQVCVEIESTPLNLRPAKFLDANVAHGTARNIFLKSEDPDNNVLVAIVNNEGKSSASLLIPQNEGTDRKIVTLDFTPDETQNNT